MTRRNALIAVLGAVPAAGQSVIGAKAGLCYYAEGAVWLDGKRIDGNGLQLEYLERGAPLETEQGRAEILLGPHSVLRTWGATEVELADTDLDHVIVALRSGSIIVDVNDRWGRERVTVQTPDGHVELSKLGVYRFDRRNERPTRVKVYQGEARVAAAEGKLEVNRGRFLRLSEAEPQPFNVRRGDAFDAWGQRRREELARARDAGAPPKRKRRALRRGFAAGGARSSRRR